MIIGVTGFTGFIGKKVINHILEFTDYSIILLGREMDEKYISNQRVMFEKFDLMDNDFEPKSYPDVLIHLAWIGIPNYSSNIHDRQVVAHLKFLKKYFLGKTKRIIVSGTCFEYGEIQGEILEENILHPNNVYASSKVKLYNLICSDSAIDLKKLTWLRLFYIYGEGQHSNSLWTSLVEADKNGIKNFIIENPSLELDFLRVEKVAKILLSLVEHKGPLSGAMNVGSGATRSIQHIAQEIIFENDLQIVLSTRTVPLNGTSNIKSMWANIEKLERCLNGNSSEA